MSDQQLRELERRWKETGSAEDGFAWLRARVQVGDLSKRRLRFAAQLGDQESKLVLATPGPPPRRHQFHESCQRAGEQGKPLVVEAICALSGVTWPLVETVPAEVRSTVANGLAAARAWLDCPCERHARKAWTAGSVAAAAWVGSPSTTSTTGDPAILAALAAGWPEDDLTIGALLKHGVDLAEEVEQVEKVRKALCDVVLQRVALASPASPSVPLEVGGVDAPRPERSMSPKEFWAVIDTCRTSPDLERRLVELGFDTVVSFARTNLWLTRRAYSYDLWAAAYTIRGGCSDDSFMDFRDWLISRGQDVYEAAMADPESLAEDPCEPPFDGLVSMAIFGAFEQGPDGQDAYYERVYAGFPPAPRPSGEDWEDEDLPARCPRLWARFG